MKSNIALIGFMGTGKTVVGRALAERLGKKFVETDALIERRAGKTIPAIFREDGEIAFRALEIGVTAEVSRQKNTVIACGGGIVLNRINIDRLRRESRVVCLTASPEGIIRRTSPGGGSRPLLDVADPAGKIAELLRLREPFYRSAADITVNTSDRGVTEVVTEIIGRLENDEN